MIKFELLNQKKIVGWVGQAKRDVIKWAAFPSEVSKWDGSCCQITVVVLMLALFIFGAVCFILQWNGVPLPW